MAIGLGLGLSKFGGGAFSPLSLFSGGEQGAWYDPSDMATLFQDHICTQPVTALEQTVAFMLDKSRGLIRGSEAVVNGDFSNGLTNWSAIGTGGSSTVVSGELEITGGGGNTPGRRQVITTVVGTLYEITVTARQGTTVQTVAAAFSSSVLSFSTTSNQTKTMKVIATSTSTNFDLTISNAAASGTAYFDNVSVKALPGLHVGQQTAGSRPVLSARVNLLLATDGDLATGSWSTGANISGTVQGDGSSLVARTSTAAAAYAGQSGVSVQIGMPFVAQIKVKKATIGNLYGLRVQGTYPDRADAVINLDTGAIAYSGGTSFTGISASSSGPDASGFYTITLNATVANSAVLQVVHGPANTAGGSWEATSATLLNGYAKQPQLIRGSVPMNYQRVTTSTNYDTVGFPSFLRFDGTDDGLFTPYLPAGQTFPFTMICALRTVGNSLGGVFGLWGGAPPYYEIQKTTTGNQWRAFDRGTVNYSNSETTAQTSAHVLTMEMATTTVNLRVDTTDPTAATTQDNLIGTLTDIRIGNGGGGFFGGNFYGGILRFGTLTTAQRLSAEKFLGTEAGLLL